MASEAMISEWYHEASKARKRPFDTAEPVPVSWINIHFKTYPRFPHVTLEKPSDLGPLGRVLAERKSVRAFGGLGLSKTELSTLLRLGCGIIRREGGRSSDSSRRTYPSAGARYPIEVYPIVLRGELKPGVYHYDVLHNQLDILLESNRLRELLNGIFIGAEEIIAEASVIFVLSAVFDRNQAKYGERGYRYSLIELGHVAQNLVLLSTALGLGSCAFGGFYEDGMDSLLELEPTSEGTLYSVIVGK